MSITSNYIGLSDVDCLTGFLSHSKLRTTVHKTERALAKGCSGQPFLGRPDTSHEPYGFNDGEV